MPALQSLAPYQGTGWAFQLGAGYYVHRGYVYLMGLVTNENAPVSPVTQTILTGLPEALRPSSEVKLTLAGSAQETLQTRDAALILPLTWAATVRPDGTLKLDEALPPSVNEAPSGATYFYYPAEGGGEHKPRYAQPMRVGIVIGNARWPIAFLSDSFEPASLAASLGPDLTDISSGYVLHGTRVHLAGSVTAAVDGAAVSNAFTLPEGTAANLPAEVSETTVGAYGLYLPKGPAGGKATVDEDSPIKASGETPPLTYATPEGHVSTTKGSPNYGSAGCATRTHSETREAGTVKCGTHTCFAATGALPLSFNIEELLAECQPTPDWFAIRLSWSFGVFNQANAGPCEGAECGPLIALDGTISLSGAGVHGTLRAMEDASKDIASAAGGGLGWVCPSAPAYIGDPIVENLGEPGQAWHGVASYQDALWKPGALASIGATTPYQANHFTVSYGITVIPFYYMRQHGLHKGDLLDFTGSGWEGAEGGNLTVGPGRSGMVSRESGSTVGARG